MLCNFLPKNKTFQPSFMNCPGNITKYMENIVLKSKINTTKIRREIDIFRKKAIWCSCTCLNNALVKKMYFLNLHNVIYGFCFTKLQTCTAINS